jgi:hypothetical protein
LYMSRWASASATRFFSDSSCTEGSKDVSIYVCRIYVCCPLGARLNARTSEDSKQTNQKKKKKKKKKKAPAVHSKVYGTHTSRNVVSLNSTTASDSVE